MSKKEKTIELGKVMKPNGTPFFSFDNSIKSIDITREYVKDGETFTEVLTVLPKDEKYLSGAFINKYADNVKFKLDKGWIDEAKATSDLAFGEKQSISSIFQVKVQEK